MSKQKKGLVPELRFAEFEDDAPWTNRPLASVLNEHGLKSTGKEVVFSVSVHKGLINQVEHLGRSFSASNTDNYNRVIPGDIVYTKSPTGDFPLGIIKQSKVDTPVIVSPLYGVFSPETKGLGALLDAYFETPANTKLYLDPLVQKGAKNTINVTNKKFLSGSLPLPISKAEQEKLGYFIDSIDELITLHTQKLGALKDHKKGLMQQLFPAEGETVPKLRFPEFKGDWVEVMLGQAAKYENGKAHEQDIDARGQYIVVNSKFISTAGEIRKFSNSANLLAEKDDILMVLSDVPNGRAIAKCFYVDKDEKYTVNQRICKLTAKKGYVSKLLYYVIDKNSYFLEFDDGVKQTNLKKDDVLNCPLWVPNDIKEQKKIVGLLDSIDDSIFHQERKLLSLKSHKAGLLQKLFPVMDDVVS